MFVRHPVGAGELAASREVARSVGRDAAGHGAAVIRRRAPISARFHGKSLAEPGDLALNPRTNRVHPSECLWYAIVVRTIRGHDQIIDPCDAPVTGR